MLGMYSMCACYFGDHGVKLMLSCGLENLPPCACHESFR